ncbi:hypothetical protein FQN57_000143 [Myotisia sp. PD_48]|nr:hypothetical protein FQN57_000143 [Myotisia sp. PD_48]
MATPSSSANPQPKQKLFGRAFYESIGSPKMVMAPMVDRSEFAWRMLTRSLVDPKATNPILTYSPMFHARLFHESEPYRRQHFEPTRVVKTEGQPNRIEPFLDGNPEFDRPLFVQFCANDPDDLLKAARLVEPYCDAVDLNLGCPQGIAKKGHYGAFLQEDPGLIFKLINKLHTELSIPVTAKFRILETKEKTLAYARLILDAGASIIAVHGRRREQKGHNTGVADWSYIRYLRDNLPPETVIFANGNILNHGDIQNCLEATGADAVMSAEGNLSDPSIFCPPPPVQGENREDMVDHIYWRGLNGEGGYRLDYILRQYMSIIYTYVVERDEPDRPPVFILKDLQEATTNGKNHTLAEANHMGKPGVAPAHKSENLGMKSEETEDSMEPPLKKRKQARGRATSPNLCAMQGHLFQLLRHLITKRTDIRDALAKCGVSNWAQFENVVRLVDRAVESAIIEYEEFPEWYNQPLPPKVAAGVQVIKSEESQATSRKYKQPWWVCQPYIRPLPEEALQLGALQLKKKKGQQNQQNQQGQQGQQQQASSNSDSPSGNGTGPVTGIGRGRKIILASDPLVSG